MDKSFIQYLTKQRDEALRRLKNGVPRDDFELLKGRVEKCDRLISEMEAAQ